MSLKSLALALCVLLGATCAAHATALTPNLPVGLYGDESIVSTDDARAILNNPAALGLRYPDELFASFARYNPHREWNTTLWNHGGFGLQMLRQRDTSQVYGAAFAWGSERLRFGWSPYWLVAGKPVQQRTGDHRLGLMSRPAPWLSAGFTVDHLFQPIFRGTRRARWYTLGLGLRPLALSGPLAHTWGTRLTFTGDVTMVDDGDWRQARVRVGSNFELLPGIALRAVAEDHSNLFLGITFSGPRWTAGYSDVRHRTDPHYQTYSASVHSGEETTVLRTAAERRVVAVKVGGTLADEPLEGVSLLGGNGGTASAPIHRALERALEDPLTRGVLLELNGVGGMAQLEELRPRILRLRQAGKPVVADMEYGGGRGDLYLASACDRVYSGEENEFSALGLRAERRYYKQFLADLGLKLDRSSYGIYKSAYRNFSADSTPPADTVSINRQLDQQQAMFLATLASGRHLAPERVEPFLDGRAFLSVDLARGGLIDSVGYRDQALAELGRLAGLGPKPHVAGPRRIVPARREWTRRTPVAVVYASGGIDVGRSGNDLLTGAYMGDQTIVAQLESAFHNPGVKAVVFRIESTGGSALASNLIDHAVQRLKRETGKPLIVSMGSVAGSGGYYIACHADRIYADQFTRTGSIGVLFVKPSLQGFYEKHHVREDDFDRGDYMAGSSMARDWTPRMQALADSTTKRFYRNFVNKVVEGRHLESLDVIAAAQGRVWLGEDALDRKLVDAIGGLDVAVNEARRRAGVPVGEKIRLLEFHRPTGGWLSRVLGGYVREALGEQLSVHDWSGAQAREEDGYEELSR